MTKVKIMNNSDGDYFVDNKKLLDFSTKEKKDLFEMMLAKAEDKDSILYDIIISMAEEFGDYYYLTDKDDDDIISEEWYEVEI